MKASLQTAGRGVWRRWARGLRRRGAAALLAAAALGWLAAAAGGGWPARAHVQSAARFPHVPARRLAHALADFSLHARLYPHLGEWTLEEESGNYSAWRYAVSYACGARCAGRARVLARDLHAAPAPRHAPPPAHSVAVHHRVCRHLPLLTFLQFCDEWETESLVEAVGGAAHGAALTERAAAACGAGRAVRLLLRGDSCAAELRRQRDQHLRRLHDLLYTIDA